MRREEVLARLADRAGDLPTRGATPAQVQQWLTRLAAPLSEEQQAEVWARVHESSPQLLLGDGAVLARCVVPEQVREALHLG